MSRLTRAVAAALYGPLARTLEDFDARLLPLDLDVDDHVGDAATNCVPEVMRRVEA
ncbi:MAG: hypothetical protein AAGA42_10380 [Actinomycetota bacterium]